MYLFLEYVSTFKKIFISNGHFSGDYPWMPIDDGFPTEAMAEIVGAKPSEVCIMNTLSVNLHFMLLSFYRPTKDRYKIIYEAQAFPSDYFALESQVRYHGFDPKDALVAIQPGEDDWVTEESIMNALKEDVAVICLAGVQYYSGQLFDIGTI